MLQKITGNNFNNFVAYNANSLSHATHLVVDLTNLTDSNDELVTALKRLKGIYLDMRIIVIADSDEIKIENKDLLRRIYDSGIYNIATESSPEELEKCILRGKTAEECNEFFVERPNLTEEHNKINIRGLVEEPKKPEELQIESVQEKIMPDKSFRKYCPSISVALCGTESHVGVTHNALLITKFLSSIGFKTCYLEAGENQWINNLKQLYPSKCNVNERKKLMQCFGIDIYSGFEISKVMAEKYDIYIFDLGVFITDKLTSFLTKDISILISGAKAWELPMLENTLKSLSTKNDIHILLNKAVTGSSQKVLEVLQIYPYPKYFVENVENPFTEGVNIEIYKKIFKEYLIVEQEEIKEVQQKKGIFKFRR